MIATPPTALINAVTRARAYSPFLAMLLDREPGIEAAAREGRLPDPPLLDPDLPAGVALRRERRALALTVALGDLSGVYDLTAVTRRLTEAEVNVRLGTQIFADSIKRFGGVHFALAAYNAGDSRVLRWQREKPGLPQDEFIDDIPFPETQNYVKRILGTAEDYRYLYSSH